MSTGTAISPASKSFGGQTSDEFSCDTHRGWTTGFFQHLVVNRLSKLRTGKILLNDKCEQTVLGQPDLRDLSATVTVRDASFYRQLALGGSIGAAEAYIDGAWDCDDLPTLIRIFSADRLNQSRSGIGNFRLTGLVSRFSHWLAKNTIEGSRRNIQAHYDLGNDFFQLFLDESMMYSSGIYESRDTTLEEAQQCRLNRVASQLAPAADEHVLEIGTGWGGCAIHLAKATGCRVTTTTISDEQYHYARKAITAAGLADRITVLKQDYRNLTGQFDHIVSLEMIEAVGPQYYDTYFAKCAELLKPGGRLLLQAIVMPEQRYEEYLRSVDFIQKYVFPGGSLPSVGAMQRSVSKTTGLRLVDLTDFADGYARTLRDWRQRFTARIDEARQLGYSDAFLRLWDYYFSYCEGAFEERAVGVVHAMWSA